ncbi:MAG: lipd A biosynthesis protein [Bacteroidales bacterium]|nr:lipd A biosynthesis protein [Bacteroidales bacterium]MBR2857257.1 lipd A biosynthesis protein [Bacteroidales bacterium]
MKEKILLALLTFILKSIAIWPYRVLYFLSDLIYPLLYHVVRYRRKVVHANLVNSFPEKSEEEIKDIERKFYRHFCDYVMETVKLMHVSDDQMRRRMRFTNSGLIEELRKDGRPFFVYLGHQGNWEYITSISLWTDSSLSGCQIYHPLSNKVMEKLVYRLRARFNTTGIPQKSALRSILTMMKEGKQPLLGLIADQRPQRYPEPEWMTFLNQDTPIITGGETLGRRLDAHFIYGSVKSIRRGYYEITLHPIVPAEGEDFPYSKQYMRMLEADIREQPHMWLWSHKRWSFRREDYLKR